MGSRLLQGPAHPRLGAVLALVAPCLLNRMKSVQKKTSIDGVGCRASGFLSKFVSLVDQDETIPSDWSSDFKGFREISLK